MPGVHARISSARDARIMLRAQHGAAMRDAAEWELNGDFCRRIGIYPHRLRYLVIRYELRKGPPIELDQRGESKRIVAIKSNPQFDKFCREERA